MPPSHVLRVTRIDKMRDSVNRIKEVCLKFTTTGGNTAQQQLGIKKEIASSIERPIAPLGTIWVPFSMSSLIRQILNSTQSFY